MELIPAIDLLDGNVVRLTRGDYADVTVYAADPLAQASRFAEAGARRIHVVDLDGARDGVPGHIDHISAIVDGLGIAVQVGGGIRDRASAERWIDAGVDRVVLGTVAVKDPELAAELCDANPGRVVIAIDARGEEVAVEGWRERTRARVDELARTADGWGAAAILYTDIERDGTSEGPAVEKTARLSQAVRATVIASGGIGALKHLSALRSAGVQAAVCGRALYSGAFTVEEAIRVSGSANRD